MNRKLRREVRRRNPRSSSPAHHNRTVAMTKGIRRAGKNLTHLAALFHIFSRQLDDAVLAMGHLTDNLVELPVFEKVDLPRSRSLGFDPTDHDDEDNE